MRRTGYQNAVLTAIAVILALGLIERHSGTAVTEPAAASAQPEPDHGGMTNELEQNKQMIAELRMLNQKMDRMDAKLSAGLSVKVTSMPAVQFNGGPDKKEKAEAPKPAPPAPSK